MDDQGADDGEPEPEGYVERQEKGQDSEVEPGNQGEDEGQGDALKQEKAKAYVGRRRPARKAGGVSSRMNTRRMDS
jgi:hypothetical protein